MSNEFVMVPRELLERALAEAISDWERIDAEWGPTTGGLEGAIERGDAGVIPELRDILAKPADQRHGEPVAWIVHWAEDGSFYTFTRDKTRSEKLRNDPEFISTPLYTHADPGEVERLRSELADTREAYLNQSARLVKANQEIERIKNPTFADTIKSPPRWVRAALSASAEPDAES